MQKNYLLIGGAVILILGSLFFFGSKDKPSGDGTESTLTPALSFSHSHGIAVDVTDAKKVYIATHEGLYLLSDDKDLYQIGKTRDDLMGFSPHPTEAQIFFSSGHPSRGGNIGFQKTTDGGLSWTRISDGLGGRVDFHSMTVSQVNPSIVYGFFGGKLQRSTDEGRTWEYAKGTIAPISLSSDTKDESTLYASTQNGVQVSKDRGETWHSVSPQLEGGAVSVFVIDPTSTYALAFSEKLGGMGKSVDGGTTWQKVQDTFGSEAVLYIAFSKSQTRVVYALTNKNSVYKSTDSGTAWTKVR
jgi:photosystem II stability/assembly factor-like uncharacterized protein